jgi:hypothetical protein
MSGAPTLQRLGARAKRGKTVVDTIHTPHQVCKRSDAEVTWWALPFLVLLLPLVGISAHGNVCYEHTRRFCDGS